MKQFKRLIIPYIHVMRFNESEEDFDARLESYED